MRTRWNPWEDRPIETAAELCMALRRVTNSDESRSVAILEIMEDHPRAIIFYSYDYELDILRSLGYPEGTEVAEWNGHKHQEIPTGKKWVYFHCWENWSNVIDASPLRGGHPGGQIGQVYGIVEFKDGVRRIDPAKIKFCDDENAILAEMEKHNRAGKLEGQ